MSKAKRISRTRKTGRFSASKNEGLLRRASPALLKALEAVERMGGKRK